MQAPTKIAIIDVMNQAMSQGNSGVPVQEIHEIYDPVIMMKDTY
jgi:hypothetical protein